MGGVSERTALARRVLLKLSGEILAGRAGAIDSQGLALVCGQINGAREAGSEVAVVCGAGNIFRGNRGAGCVMPRTTADSIGMVATLANCLAIEGALAAREIPARVLCAFEAPRIADLATPRSANESLSRGEVVLFAGGTGNPYFTTDTAAALRALEIGCSLLIKGTKVDGVYSADPLIDPNAPRFARLTYAEVLQRRLGVMDLTAVTLCMENDLPIVVLNARQPGSVAGFLRGEELGTLIVPGEAAPQGAAGRKA